MPTNKADGFSVNVRNDAAKKYLDNIQRNLRGLVSESVGKELVRLIRLYPRYKYVTRKKAYGETFVSDKQRKFVMAKIREGSISPGHSNRTMTLKKGWKTTGERTKTRIINDVPYAGFVQGNVSQSAHEYMAGWKKVNVLIKENIQAAMAYARGKVSQLVKSKTT
jgi:hypothetical protein